MSYSSRCCWLRHCRLRPFGLPQERKISPSFVNTRTTKEPKLPLWLLPSSRNVYATAGGATVSFHWFVYLILWCCQCPFETLIGRWPTTWWSVQCPAPCLNVFFHRKQKKINFWTKKCEEFQRIKNKFPADGIFFFRTKMAADDCNYQCIVSSSISKSDVSVAVHDPVFTLFNHPAIKSASRSKFIFLSTHLVLFVSGILLSPTVHAEMWNLWNLDYFKGGAPESFLNSFLILPFSNWRVVSFKFAPNSWNANEISVINRLKNVYSAIWTKCASQFNDFLELW